MLIFLEMRIPYINCTAALRAPVRRVALSHSPD
jgi:hypothetical protein